MKNENYKSIEEVMMKIRKRKSEIQDRETTINAILAI